MIALLFISLLIPAATALLLMLFRTSLNQSSARWVACCGSIAALLFSVLLLVQYRVQVVDPFGSGVMPVASSVDPTSAIQPRVEYRQPWLKTGEHMQLEMYFGLDGISVTMIALTTTGFESSGMCRVSSSGGLSSNCGNGGHISNRVSVMSICQSRGGGICWGGIGCDGIGRRHIGHVADTLLAFARSNKRIRFKHAVCNLCPQGHGNVVLAAGCVR